MNLVLSKVVIRLSSSNIIHLKCESEFLLETVECFSWNFALSDHGKQHN